MIYFIQEVGLLRNRIKIGYTENIRERIKEIQSGCPSKLRILLVLPGSMKDEFLYQQMFFKYHLHNEWFKYGFHLRLFVWFNQLKAISTRQATEIEYKEIEFELTENEASFSDIEPEPDEKTLEIIELWQQYKNWSKIHMTITGTNSYPGGTDIKRYKATLDEWGIEYD